MVPRCYGAGCYGARVLWCGRFHSSVVSGFGRTFTVRLIAAAPDTAQMWNRRTRSLADCADDRFHVDEVLLECATAGSGQIVFGPRDAAFERLLAHDVLGVFELSRMHAQVAVGRVEQALEVVEREALV